MCGICGFVGLSPKDDDEGLLRRMNATLTHRGPDDEGSWSSGAGPAVCHLAMRRLSIIDLEGGHQPIANESGTCWIVYNGETYNYQPLKLELERKGHRFHTHTDTEVVLRAYEEFGLSFVERLRGMYALAIWDAVRQRLVLARDPVGIKPLFYAVQGDRLYFASEIKSLLQAGLPRALDPLSLYQYLTFLYVPPPGTMFAGIQKVRPGHRLVWEKGVVSTEEFWRGPTVFLQESSSSASVADLWPALLDSVQAHLVSDVPVGVFLSGGLDSSSLALAATELGYRPFKTFCIGFRGAGLYDESPQARLVSEFLGTDHYEQQVDSSIVEDLPSVMRFLDEPLADASVLPNFFLARLAARHVKVVLSGTGGDELLGGYHRYVADRYAAWASRLVPRWLRTKVLLPLLRARRAGGDSRLGNLVRLMDKFLTGLSHSQARRYLHWNSFFGEEEKLRLLRTILFSTVPSPEILAPFLSEGAGKSFEERAMYADLKTYLPGDLLLLTDRLTMAHSLEARVPFVDTPFMEFSSRLPVREKVRGLTTKVCLRKALTGRLPASILSRPKQGFGTPIDLWLRREMLAPLKKLLSPESVKARGLFRPDFIQSLIARHLQGEDLSQHLWSLVVLELWHRMYLDRDYSTRANLSFGDLV